MKDMNRKSWMKISNEDLCTKIIPKYVSSDNKRPQSLKNKILKIAEYNLNAKKKKDCNDSNIRNKKLEIKEIYWKYFLTKFSKVLNSYYRATIFNLC